MTPQIATLTLHESPAAELSLPRPGELLHLPVRHTTTSASLDRPLPWRIRREARHRRLLGVADMLAAAVALALALDPQQVYVFAALPLVVLLFKISGLYDRDEVRLV